HEGIGEALRKLGRTEEALDHYHKSLEFRQAALPDYAQVPHYLVAVAYYNLGLIMAQRASEAKWTKEQRRQFWSEAKDWYQPSLQVVRSMQERKLPLSKETLKLLNECPEEIVQCREKAITELKKSEPTRGGDDK